MIAPETTLLRSTSIHPSEPPHTWVCDTPGGIVGIFQPEVQVAYYRRKTDPRIVEYLDVAAPAVHTGKSVLVQAGKTVDLTLPERPGRDALLHDIQWLMRLYTDLLGCPAAALRIEVLNKPMCPRFHVDRTGIRLVCTWRGPGTEWLDDAWTNRERLGAGNMGLADEESGLMLPGAVPVRAPGFAIALLKGSSWQYNEGRGLIHRSPAILAQEAPRVMMSLDAVWEY